MKTLSQEVKNKSLVCYGIGDEFHNMVNNYADYPWCAQIEYLVDNNIHKYGFEECVGDKKLRITNLDEFLTVANENMVIIISCGAFREVIDHLNSIPQLDKLTCYVYYFMMGRSEHKEVKIAQRENMLIPPKLHYCWFGGKELPDLYKRCVESWYKYCPDYEIVCWDESNCDITETVFTQQAYEVGKYGFVPDYFRLKIIYEHGGIYLDTDVELLKNLDDLRYNEAFAGMEVPGRVALGLGFGAAKGNKTIQYLLKRYETMRFIGEDGRMEETASPIWQTKDLCDLGMGYGNKVHNVNGMTIYPVEVLSPKNIVTGELDITKYSYTIHHYDGSWVTGENLRKKQQREMDVAKINKLMQG